MATLLNPFLRALDANADSVSGGLLYVFEAGTTTPVTTYSDSALATAQAHPLVANSAGEFAQSFIESGTYKIRITDDAGGTLYEVDNVRMADRPDSPIFLDDKADIFADTTSYATGTIVNGEDDGARYEIAASGATDHTDTRDDGQKMYNLKTRNAHTGAIIAGLDDGETMTLEGITYVSETGGTVMGDLGVTGVSPFDFVVDARAYGIIGDNVTDDTSQIARAAASGLTIDFGNMTPKVSSQITLSEGTTFLGAGPQTCRFKAVDTMTYANSVLYSEADNITIVGIGCDGGRTGTDSAATGAGYFIKLSGGDNCRVNYCDAQEVTGSGFWWEDMTNSNFDHNTTKNTGKEGVTNNHGILINTSETDTSAYGTDNVSVRFCTVDTPLRKGIATASSGAKLRGIRICDNYIKGATTGGVFVGGTVGLTNPFYHEACQVDRNFTQSCALGISVSNLLGGSARDNEVHDATSYFGYFSAMKGTDLRGNQGHESARYGWYLTDTVDEISGVTFTDFTAYNTNTSGNADAPRVLLDGVTDSLIGNGKGDAGGATYDLVEYSPATGNHIFNLDGLGGGSVGDVLFLNTSSTSTIEYADGRKLSYSLTLTNGANNNVALPYQYENFVINGPDAAYTITGFTNGRDGRHITLSSNVGVAGSIETNDVGSDAANRIIPPNGVDFAFDRLTTVDLTWNALLQSGRWGMR